MYWLLVYQFLEHLLDKLNKMCAFFLGGSARKVSLKVLCKPKTKEVIGLKPFFDLKKAACFKLM